MRCRFDPFHDLSVREYIYLGPGLVLLHDLFDEQPLRIEAVVYNSVKVFP